MADLKPQVYKDPRPAEHFTRYHERARRGIGWTYKLVRVLLTPPTLLVYRARAIGMKNVPKDGPAIITPNHFSQMDHFFSAVFLRRRVQFMAKSQLFTNPILVHIFSHGGVFPVRRGYNDQEAFITAHAVLAREGRDCIVLMYAEGGRSRTGSLGEPKRGVGKLALESGAPVVPVAIHGSASVRRWKKLRFPKVTVQYGAPVSFDRVESPTPEQQQEAAEKVFERVRAMYDALEAKGRRGVLRDLRHGDEPGPLHLSVAAAPGAAERQRAESHSS